MKSRKVAQYDLDGNFIKVYDSVNHAAKDVNLKSHTGILGCCKFKPNSNSTAGYQWRYVEESVDYTLKIEPVVKRGDNFKKKYGSSTKGASLVNEKRRKTLIDRYGVDHPMRSDSIRKKYKDSCMEMYGETNPAKNPKIRKKISDTERNKKLLVILTDWIREFR
jgi:hypothetical protein